MSVQIPRPPSDLSQKPDIDTNKSPDLARGPDAPGRVLHLNMRWLSYGSNDKAHAAAFVLSFALLFLVIILGIFALISAYFSVQATWIDTVFQWVGNAFLFTAGAGWRTRRFEGMV